MNTDFNPANIQEGMDVYDSAGSKIGSISDIYFDTESITWNPSSGTGYQNASDGPNTTATATASRPTTTGYFKVTQGGILGIGAKDIYVPFDAVTSMDPGTCLTVNCVKGECDGLYGDKPDWIH